MSREDGRHPQQHRHNRKMFSEDEIERADVMVCSATGITNEPPLAA